MPCKLEKDDLELQKSQMRNEIFGEIEKIKVKIDSFKQFSPQIEENKDNIIKMQTKVNT